VHPTENIGTGMINKIIKDAKITRDEWIELIKSLILFRQQRVKHREDNAAKAGTTSN
jgi:hypothetical protein